MVTVRTPSFGSALKVVKFSYFIGFWIWIQLRIPINLLVSMSDYGV